MNIELPTKKGDPNTNPEIEFEQLVVVGANGSGKTRFGSDIEQRYNQKVHRVSAQKSLTMPDNVSTKSKEVAQNEFLYGGWDKNNPDWHREKGWLHNRWGDNPNTYLLNDYEKLMVLLHTEEYEKSLDYKENGGEKPNTELDRIQDIWEVVLPHRKLNKKAGVINVYPPNKEANIYNASEMSDGERVIFYLIGEVICAPEDSIIIIDEPEMHLHKSIAKNLFDLIEKERQDCSFIYLTHDIDFALSRQSAKKIWAKEYETNVWDYEILEDETPIPEQLYIDVLGSRKPIIFLEGDSSSIDYELYGQVYDNKTLKPVGSCNKVMQIVKAFRAQQNFHHIESFGIIDRDRRKEAEIASLNNSGIWVLDVAEVKNLLLIGPVVKAVSVHMGKNENDVFNNVRENIINFFSVEIDSQILLHFQEILRRKYIELANFTSSNISNAILEIDAEFGNIDKQSIYNDIENNFRNALANRDYTTILRAFNLKNALIPNSKVCEMTGIRNKLEYKSAVISLLKRKDEISDEIKTGINSKIIKNAS